MKKEISCVFITPDQTKESKKFPVVYVLHQKEWETHMVNYNVSSLKNNELKLMIDCGIDDPLLEVNRSLHEKLILLKIVHDYTLSVLGHMILHTGQKHRRFNCCFCTTILSNLKLNYYENYSIVINNDNTRFIYPTRYSTRNYKS